MTCTNCRTDPARRKGLCDACYQHKWRTGADRPETNVIKLNTKRFEDEIVAKRARTHRP